MLSKLAIRNAKRSARDYGVYLMTAAFSVALVYSFNTLIFSQEIQKLSSGLDVFGGVIIFISCIVVYVIGWLIHYMMRFMLERRSKEFGTYMLLGISNRDISRLFRQENLLMGTVAFLGGILLGTLIYQFLALIIMHIFGVDYQITFTFSPGALGLSVLYFGGIYLFALMRTGKRLKQMKICDLIYAEKKNENGSLAGKKNHWLIFLISMLVLAAGCFLLWQCAFNKDVTDLGYAVPVLFSSLVLIIAGIYGTYMTMTSLFAKVILSRPSVKYRGNRLFLTRTLTARLRKTGTALGTLALLLTLTLTAAQLGVLFKDFFLLRSRDTATFDVGISRKNSSAGFQEGENLIEEDAGIVKSHVYPVYQLKSDSLYQYFRDLGHSGWMDMDVVIAYSDYRKLCSLLDMKPLVLQDGQYLLYSMSGMKNRETAQSLPPLEINGTPLHCQEWRTDPFNLGNGLNGTGYVAVISDSLAEGLDIFHSVFAAMTERKPSNFLEGRLEELYFTDPATDFDCLYTRTTIENDSLSTFIIFSFSLFYVGLIFACVAATILAVQQLSESSKYKFRYKILAKLGVGRRERRKLVFKNILFYFAVPLLIPIPLSWFITKCLNHLILLSQISEGRFRTAVCMSTGLFGLVYLLYFAAAYVGCRKNS